MLLFAIFGLFLMVVSPLVSFISHDVSAVSTGSGTTLDPYSGSYEIVIDWEKNESIEDEIAFCIEEGTSFTLVNNSAYTLAYGPWYISEDGDVFSDGDLLMVVESGGSATTAVTRAADVMITDQNGADYEFLQFGIFQVEHDSYSGLWCWCFSNYVTVKPMPAGMSVHTGTQQDPIVDGSIVYITEEINGTTLFCVGYPKDVVFVNSTGWTLTIGEWDYVPSGPTTDIPGAEFITLDGYLVDEINYNEGGTGDQIRNMDVSFYVLFGAVSDFAELRFLSDPVADGTVYYV